MNKFSDIEEYIIASDFPTVTEKLVALKAAIDEGNTEAIEYISTPNNITRLHNLMVEHMKIVRKLLQLRGRVPNARHRASLFVQAMMNAVRLSPNVQ